MPAEAPTTTPVAAKPPPAAPTPAAPAWSEPELASPHTRDDKPARVQAMFAAIARSYDLNNRLHSMWQDQAWRRFAVKQAQVRASDDVLDCACGTGDLTRLFAKARARRVTGLDFTPQMLEIARTKSRFDAPTADGSRITYVEGDATKLPFADASFDVVSIAFGIRNVSDPAKALREFRRVLRPGGRLVILEFDRPTAPLLGSLSDFYTRRVMPITATLISRDRSGAYKYLPRSVATFLNREQLALAMQEAGFSQVSSHALTFGICVCSVGRV